MILYLKLFNTLSALLLFLNSLFEKFFCEEIR